MRRLLQYILSVFLLLLVSQKTVAQQVTISNNLLYDATLTPNLRLGVRLSPHWSLGVTAGYRPWPTSDDTSKKWKHLLVSPDLRYWTDSVNVHHFFGINPVYVHYNISGIRLPLNLYQLDKEKRYQGDFGGIGVFYGYSWPLGRHWNIEALIGGIVGFTKYDTYECGQCGKKIDDGKKFMVFPQAALNVVYNIPGRPAKVKEEVVQAVVLPQEPEKTTAKVEEKVYKPVVSPVPDFTGRAGELQKTNPVLAHVSEYKPYDRTRILRKEKDALYVHFALGKSVLDNSFRENRVTLDRIIDVTRQIIADTTSSVQKIQIVGLASVEGPIWGNERLAQNRAMALQQYIQQHVALPDSMFETIGGGEAWAEFRDQLSDELLAGNASLQGAIDIIDNEENLDVRERQLRQLDKGRIWQYIKNNILKDQRNSGFIRIYYDYVPDRAAAAINRASEMLNAGQYAEALALLQTVRTDERAQNALGTALWLCGQKEEALRCFRRAAAKGNADAQENLRQLENNN